MKANLITRTIELTAVEAKAAGKLNSDKANELKAYRTEYPDFEIKVVAAPKRKNRFKGLDYKYMEKYILAHDNEQHTLMNTFNELRGIITEEEKELYNVNSLESTSYMKVKEWFLSTFPEIKKFHEDHENKVKRILGTVA